MVKKEKNSGEGKEPREVQDPGSAEEQGVDTDNEAGGEAPAIISERSKSEPDKPPESDDIIYLTKEEVSIEEQIHTLDTVFIEDTEASSRTHMGPWIERCTGRDPDSKKLIVYTIPAKAMKIPPKQVLQYLGSVVMDRQAVHTATIVYPGRQRNGYVFDRFYYLNGKKEPRCCWIPNRIHMAGLLFEKVVDKKSRKAFPRIRRIRGHLGADTGEPMYKVLGAKETDYRDFKRLYERHFLKRGEEDLADDIGLKRLIGGQ